MGKYKEDAQDDILRQMDKLNRRSTRDSTDYSLSSQLKAQEKYEKLTIEQKRASTPIGIWKEHLRNYIVQEKNICTNKTFDTICVKFSSNIEEFHQSGVSFSETIQFFEKKTFYYNNRNL
jgi:hypothetical protein